MYWSTTPEPVLEGWSNVNVWIEHETWLNEMLPGYDDPVICTYHANLLDGTIEFCAPTSL